MARPGVSQRALEFTHHNHDDLERIVASTQRASGLDADAAAAMAVLLKLLSETMLEHRSNALFDGLRHPLHHFIRTLKARAAAAGPPDP